MEWFIPVRTLWYDIITPTSSIMHTWQCCTGFNSFVTPFTSYVYALSSPPPYFANKKNKA